MADSFEADDKESQTYGSQFGTHLHYEISDGETVKRSPGSNGHELHYNNPDQSVAYETNPKEKRKIPGNFSLIVSFICLGLFLIALLCFYVAPSSREVRFQTISILNDIYKSEYADESTAEFKILANDIELSFVEALVGVNYDKAEMHPYKSSEQSSIKSHPLGLLVEVDIIVTIYETPVLAHQRIDERKRQILDTVPSSFHGTFVGSLGVLEFWIKNKNTPTPNKLQCPDRTISTDPSRPTATLNLPYDFKPEVQGINGEIPRVWRLDSAPADEFPLGEYEIEYGIYYTNSDNGGAFVGCIFKITVQDTENPTLTCPPPNLERVGSTGQQYQWGEPSIVDNVSTRDNILFQSTHESGDVLDNEDVAVIFHATDEAGNTASCSFMPGHAGL